MGGIERGCELPLLFSAFGTFGGCGDQRGETSGKLYNRKKTSRGEKGASVGVGLSVRFSISIIIAKILFESGLIATDLYSVIVASSIFFTFAVPIIFSNLLKKTVSHA